MLWYLALRATDVFYSKYARWPGAMDSAFASDQKEVFLILRALCQEKYQLDAAALESETESEDVKMSAGACVLFRCGVHV